MQLREPYLFVTSEEVTRRLFIGVSSSCSLSSCLFKSVRVTALRRLDTADGVFSCDDTDARLSVDSRPTLVLLLSGVLKELGPLIDFIRLGICDGLTVDEGGGILDSFGLRSSEDERLARRGRVFEGVAGIVVELRAGMPEDCDDDPGFGCGILDEVLG